MPEVWRVPPFSHGPKSDPFIIRNNADLIAAAHQLGYVHGRTLDATWGYGKWWGSWPFDGDLEGEGSRPFVAMDIVRSKIPQEGGVQADFRRPPFRPGAFDCILYDPDYKLNGTADQEIEGPDERYGTHVEKEWWDRMADALDGIHTYTQKRSTCAGCDGDGCPYCGGPDADYHTACDTCPTCDGVGSIIDSTRADGLAHLLAPEGYLLVKCMDQVARNKIRWMTDDVTDRAKAAGLEKVDRLDLPGVPRAQPKGRSQRHARQNTSTLFVFQRPKPRRYRKFSELTRKPA